MTKLGHLAARQEEAGRFARCPVRPESFHLDSESIRPESEVVLPES